MRRPEIALHALRTERRSLISWSIGLSLTILLYLVFYPSVVESAGAYSQALKTLPESLQRLAGTQGSDYFSAVGYLQSKFFATFGFILLLVFAVGRGARALAGDEHQGLLELVLAAPVRRKSLVLQRALSLTLELALFGLITFVLLLVLGPLFEAGDLDVGNLAAACLSMSAGALVFGLVAFAIGAVTGSHAAALGFGSAAAAIGFFYATLSPLVTDLAGSQWLSPCWQAFGYQPLAVGLDLSRFVILFIEVAALAAVSVWGFARRDIR